MIPTLKTTHEQRIRKTLAEFKQNPQLLQEFDEKQLEEMERALEKLKKLFQKPEFKKLPTFQLGLQKAYSNMSDMLSTNRLMRAIKLKAELRTIAEFTDGISRLFVQLPKIARLAQNGLTGIDGWDPSKPIADMLDQDSMRSKSTSLYKQFRDAMKSGLFGRTDIPYIDNDEAAMELLNLSINELVDLQKAIESSRSIKRTIANPEFMQSFRDAAKDSLKDEDEEEIEDDGLPPPPLQKQPKLDIPPAKVEKAAGPKMPPISTIQQELAAIFNKSIKIAYPERTHQGKKLTAKEQVLRTEFVKSAAAWLAQNIK